MTPVSFDDWFPYPPDFSTHGPQIDQLINVVHVLMALLFVGWGIFFLYCLFRFRARDGHKALYEGAKGKFAKPIEVAVILAEAFLLIGMSMPVWAKLKHDFPSKQQATTVRIVGEQFAWNFHYPGPDGIFGKTDVQFIDNFGNALGLDPKDSNGKDDIITANEFHFPIDKPVIAEISSKDVIHSFTINVMRVKQDAIPGMVIPIWFQAVPGAKTGEYDISCAQLCGLGHYRMKGSVFLDTPEQFAQWMAQKQSERQGVNQ